MSAAFGLLAAIGAAMTFGTAAVVQQHSAHQVPERGPLDPRLLLDLARHPAWLAAIGATILGVALQVVALHFAPLALVQPVLVCDLLFAVLISGLMVNRRPPDRVVLAGAACCAGGLGAFLAIAEPHGGDSSTVSAFTVIPLAAGLAGVLAVCLSVAHFGSRNARPLAIALACGVVYGVTAFLLKEVSDAFMGGFATPARQWPLYAIAVIGPVGFLLNQSAFQAGILIAPVLSIITVADPLVSIGIARLWLNEVIANGPAEIAGEVLALAVMTFGIVALAHRAPQSGARARDRGQLAG